MKPYALLKYFADPESTIIGAFAAVSVTVYFARHQKKIAADQAHIAKEKLRDDRFDRRNCGEETDSVSRALTTNTFTSSTLYRTGSMLNHPNE